MCNFPPVTYSKQNEIPDCEELKKKTVRPKTTYAINMGAQYRENQVTDMKAFSEKTATV